MTGRMRFGIFLAPFHAPGTNPTLALQRDLELIQHLDALGYEEAWIGEHHSAGMEIIASPEIFIATAAERTRHIKLGTGVISIGYHHPLWIAQRLVLLDHLTRGRVMFGAGPGSLPTDAAMIGIAQSETRDLLEQGFDLVMKLLTSDEPVNFKNHRWELRDAHLHLRPYSSPLFDVAVAAVASPSGPRLAGKHGVGLLSLGATQAAGFDALGMHWSVMEQRAAQFGTVADRAKWRLVGLVHCAETRAQAHAEVAYGIEHWFSYFQSVAGLPHMNVMGKDVGEMIDYVAESGMGAIGTPDDVCAQIDRLLAQSNGGFGAYLMLAHEWANTQATRRSYELIARYVMPRYQGQAQATLNARARAAIARSELVEAQRQAIEAVQAKHAAETAALKRG
ncbi:MAG TPA: LLM class flavin-dependent oxidoreductase [Gammaproteobacteria bacterium]|nr:LLM class flavin-dependent oxidoreductase [Gammaproteobacteria bacterium]